MRKVASPPRMHLKCFLTPALLKRFPNQNRNEGSEPESFKFRRRPTRLLTCGSFSHSCSPQGGASGRDLLRRDLGAPGAHEGGSHPLQPAVHDGKLGLQTGTASSDPRSCSPAADLRGHGTPPAPPRHPRQEAGAFSRAAMSSADWA